VPVKVAGGGYDYADAARYLSDLEANLGERDASALAELAARLAERTPAVSVAQVGSLLVKTIPNIIAVTFDSVGGDHGDHHLHAVASEVVDRAARAAPAKTPVRRRLPNRTTTVTTTTTTTIPASDAVEVCTTTITTSTTSTRCHHTEADSEVSDEAAAGLVPHGSLPV